MQQIVHPLSGAGHVFLSRGRHGRPGEGYTERAVRDRADGTRCNYSRRRSRNCSWFWGRCERVARNQAFRGEPERSGEVDSPIMRWDTSGALAITCLLLMAGAAIGLALDASAQARYPKQILRIATHSSPGGGSDVFLREMAPHLSQHHGRDVRRGQPARVAAALGDGDPRRAKPDGAMFYATTPTFIYTSLLSRPAATLQGPRAAGERVLRP